MTVDPYRIQAEVLDFLSSEGLHDADDFASTAAATYVAKRVGLDHAGAVSCLARIRTNTFAPKRQDRAALTDDLIRRLDRRFLSDLERDVAEALPAPPQQSLVADYDVALSFARPQRALAEQLRTIIHEAGFSVFYDYDFAADLWGKDLAVELDAIYRERSRFCVIFISPAYVERVWPVWERQSALARAVAARGEEYILPVVVEPATVPGLRETIGRVSLSDYSIEDIGSLLVAKLRK